MINKKLQERPLRRGLIIAALVLLCNANITVVDPLPDFIGYFMLMGALSFAAKRVPYLEEVRAGLLKLALLSLARIPAFLIIIKIRSINTTDGDVYALASLVFAVIEVIFALGVIKNLFLGISYLGDRTGSRAIIGEKPSAEFLKVLSIAFTLVKCASYSLPEFARLTSTDDIGSLTTGIEGMRYYPLAFVTSHILTYVLGIMWVAYFARYLGRISQSGDFYPAVMSLTDEKKELRIERESRLSGIGLGLTFLIPATLLTFDLTFEQLHGVNVLPHFLFGVLAIIAILKIRTTWCPIYIATLATGAVYTVYSFIAWIKSIGFYDEFTISETMLYDDAEAAYKKLEVYFIVEAVIFIAFLVLITLSLIRFAKMHTGNTPFSITDPFAPGKEKDYTAFDEKHHKGVTVKLWVFFAFGVLVGVGRVLTVMFNNDREFAYGALIPRIAPWITIAVTAVSVIWCIYTYTLVGSLKEDMKLKYSDPKQYVPEEQLRDSEDFH